MRHLFYIGIIAISLSMLLFYPKKSKGQDKSDTLKYLELKKQLDYRDTINSWVPKNKRTRRVGNGDVITPHFVQGIDEIFKFIGFVLIIFLLVVLIFYLTKSIKRKSKSDVIELQDLDNIEDIKELDLDELLKSALEKEDYRLAIRILYLQVLQKLNDQKAIKWKAYKTNRNYVDELQDAEYGQEFKRLTSLFELIWYGKANLMQQDYEEYKRIISSFKKYLSDEIN